MARAHTIWIVTEPGRVKPAAAFTVKHELKEWLRRQGAPENRYHLYRCPDNPAFGAEVQTVDMNILLATP